MSLYAGLDVSDKSTDICVVDEAGAIGWHCPSAVRAVFETGALSTFLYYRLAGSAPPVSVVVPRQGRIRAPC